MRISKSISSHKNWDLVLLCTCSSHLIVFIYLSRPCLPQREEALPDSRGWLYRRPRRTCRSRTSSRTRTRLSRPTANEWGKETAGWTSCQPVTNVRYFLLKGRNQYSWPPRVLNSLDQLLPVLKTYFSFYTKQATLVRRSTIISFLLSKGSMSCN